MPRRKVGIFTNRPNDCRSLLSFPLQTYFPLPSEAAPVMNFSAYLDPVLFFLLQNTSKHFCKWYVLLLCAFYKIFVNDITLLECLKFLKSCFVSRIYLCWIMQIWIIYLNCCIEFHIINTLWFIHLFPYTWTNYFQFFIITGSMVL